MRAFLPLALIGLLALNSAASAQLVRERRFVVTNPVAEVQSDSQPQGDEPPATQPNGSAGQARVQTARGDRIAGRVLGLADGRLRLAGPQFDGEVTVLADELIEVTFARPSGDATGGRDTVMITNNDGIAGTVESITDEEIVIDSNAAGVVKVPLSAVTAVSFGKGSLALLDSHFDRGEMEPFRTVRGDWKTAGGRLVTETLGDYATVAAPVEQDGPVTMEVSLEPTGGNSVYCILCLAADTMTSGYYSNNSVHVRVYSSRYYVGYSSGGSSNTVTSQSMNSSLTGRTVLRLAFEPEAGLTKFWINGQLQGEFAVRGGPKSGKCVLFSSRYPCKVEYIRVTGGAAAPSKSGGPAKGDAHTVVFANKDRLSTQSLGLADGVLTVRTAYGELKTPVDKLSTIAFRQKGREKPRRQKGDVLVQTAASRFTLRLEALDEKALTGESDYLGPVAITPALVRSIRFNIYR